VCCRVPRVYFHGSLFSRDFVFFLSCRPSFVSKTSLNADMDKDWKETNFEGDLAKLQKEAEERLDEKIAELMTNIEQAGK
jgi:hypothetical protein